MTNRNQVLTMLELSDGLCCYLRERSYSEVRIKFYERVIRSILEFMAKEHLKYYCSETCSKYIESIIGSMTYAETSSNQKQYIRVANALLEYQTTGTVCYRTKNIRNELTGEIGVQINKYLSFRNSRNTSKDTIDAHRCYLSRFHAFLFSQGIFNIDELNQNTIIDFTNTLSFSSKSTIHCTLCCLRVFLSYLYENHILGKNLSLLVPKDSYRQDSKLPTTYTKSEIERLLVVVDRGNPKGKRDYAMILLAARLGLRASDICRLKFSNVCWERNIISLIQKKTRKAIELPLLEEIGNAIIDYLKYGRPVSSQPFLFLKAYPQYERLEEPTLHSIVSFYLKKAEIENIAKKKHGPHALRHSLAGLLLEKKTPLPIISEVLGHENTESTKSYLRIDIAALLQCALEVPELSFPIYERSISRC